MDPTDELALRDVLFGEGASQKSYAVLCHKEDETHISSVFQDAFADGGSLAEFRLLDCDYILPESEKSIAERFKLNPKQRPVVFVSGHVGPPKQVHFPSYCVAVLVNSSVYSHFHLAHTQSLQVPTKHLKTGKMLSKLLKNMLEPRAAKVETTQDLRTKCLNQDVCGLLLKGSKTVSGRVKSAVQNLLSQHPKKVAFASVDTSVLFVRNLEEYLPEFQPGVHRFVVFRKLSGGLDTKDDRLITSIATLDDPKKIGFSSMNDLVQRVVDDKASMTKLSSLPMIKTRTKKLEEEERAKRQRRQSQQQQQASPPTFAPTENDGSREGRRAERERRREAHYAEQNIKPMTPEEAQEMERQRRIRMEEEAAKWNIAPEDADSPVDIEHDQDDVMQEGDGGYRQDGDDEDDDVLDLD